jgi:hypothetical protein
MFNEQQLLKQKEMKEFIKTSVQKNLELMDDFLKCEFPKLYESEPELIWKFTMEYADSHDGLEPSEDLVCYLKNRLRRSFIKKIKTMEKKLEDVYQK